MATPGLGFKSYVQLGIETVYGTAVAATKKLEIISESISPSISMATDPSMTSSRVARALYPCGYVYKGKVKLRANYEGITALIDWAMGTATFGTAGATKTGTSDPYQYVMKVGAVLNSYTLEIGLGDIPTGKVFRLAGAKCAGITISGQAGTGDSGMLTAEVDVIATACTSDYTATALSFPAVDPIVYTMIDTTTLKNGTADTTGIRLKAFEVSLTQPLADDRFYMGSMTVDEPFPNGQATVAWKLTEEHTSKSLWDKVQGTTSSELKLTFKLSTNRLLELHSGTAYLNSLSTPVSGYGVVTTTAEWKAAYDSTDASALMITTKTADSTAL